jgi:hypothetical protein
MRYAQFLHHNISMCNYCLNVLNERVIHLNDTGVDDEECLDAIEFLMDRKLGWRSELKELNNGTHWVQTQGGLPQ